MPANRLSQLAPPILEPGNVFYLEREVGNSAEPSPPEKEVPGPKHRRHT
jgi:hypothetical protein